MEQGGKPRTMAAAGPSFLPEEVWTVKVAPRDPAQGGQQTYTMHVPTLPPALVKTPPPGLPIGPEHYEDTPDTRRVAPEVPRLLRLAMQLQEAEQQQAGGAPALKRMGTTKVKAREEIFLRRAQLAAELQKMGLPPMADTDWSTAGLKFGKVVIPGEFDQQPLGQAATPAAAGLSRSPVQDRLRSRDQGGPAGAEARGKGQPPSPARNPILVRARKAKGQLAKQAAAAKAATGARGPEDSELAGGWATVGGAGAGLPRVLGSHVITTDGQTAPAAFDSAPASRPFYPRRRRDGPLANEEEGGKMAPHELMRLEMTRRKEKEEAAAEQPPVQQAEPLPAQQEKKPSCRQERLMKLARVLLAAHEQGVVFLGVEPVGSRAGAAASSQARTSASARGGPSPLPGADSSGGGRKSRSATRPPPDGEVRWQVSPGDQLEVTEYGYRRRRAPWPVDGPPQEQQKGLEPEVQQEPAGQHRSPAPGKAPPSGAAGAGRSRAPKAAGGEGGANTKPGVRGQPPRAAEAQAAGTPVRSLGQVVPPPAVVLPPPRGLVIDLSDDEDVWRHRAVSSEDESWGVSSAEADDGGFPRVEAAAGMPGEGPALPGGTARDGGGVAARQRWRQRQGQEDEAPTGSPRQGSPGQQQQQQQQALGGLGKGQGSAAKHSNRAAATAAAPASPPVGGPEVEYESSGEWGVTDEQVVSTQRKNPEDELLELYGINLNAKPGAGPEPYRPPTDGSFPVRFSTIPQWLVAPLPWFEPGEGARPEQGQEPQPSGCSEPGTAQGQEAAGEQAAGQEAGREAEPREGPCAGSEAEGTDGEAGGKQERERRDREARLEWQQWRRQRRHEMGEPWYRSDDVLSAGGDKPEGGFEQ